MREDPRTILADGLLGWGGADYLAAGPVEGVTGLESAAGLPVPAGDAIFTFALRQ